MKTIEILYLHLLLLLLVLYLHKLLVLPLSVGNTYKVSSPITAITSFNEILMLVDMRISTSVS